jgi:hypothetical protein
MKFDFDDGFKQTQEMFDVKKLYEQRDGSSKSVSSFDCEINDNGNMIFVIDEFYFSEIERLYFTLENG